MVKLEVQRGRKNDVKQGLCSHATKPCNMLVFCTIDNIKMCALSLFPFLILYLKLHPNGEQTKDVCLLQVRC